MKKFVGIVAISAGLIISTAVRALPMELDYDGILWSWTSGDIGKTSGSILLSMDATNSSLPGTTAYLHSFLLKKAEDPSPSFTVSSATATSTAETWTWLNGELDANGCKSNGNASSMCFDGSHKLNNTDKLDITDTGIQTFTINFVFSAGVLTEALHLKVNWVTTANEVCTTNNGGRTTCGFTKVGDLVSQDFLRTPNDPDPDPDPDPNPVPLPGTLALMGLGLLTLRLHRAKKA